MADTKNALLVMDDGELCQELIALLDDMGYQVTEIDGMSDVREHLVSHKYDVLIMGATLPDLSWKATVNDLRNTTHAARVMMITRTAQDANLRSALRAGGYAVLERPISSTQLSNIIALGRYGMFVLARDQPQ